MDYFLVFTKKGAQKRISFSLSSTISTQKYKIWTTSSIAEGHSTNGSLEMISYAPAKAETGDAYRPLTNPVTIKSEERYHLVHALPSPLAPP